MLGDQLSAPVMPTQSRGHGTRTHTARQEPSHCDEPAMDSTGPSPTAPARLRRLAAESLRSHRVALALALAGLLFQSLLLLPVPLLQGWVLDRLAGGAAQRAVLARAVFVAFAATAACYLLRAAVGWAVAAGMHRVSLEVVRDLTDALHRKLQRQPLGYFDRHPTGEDQVADQLQRAGVEEQQQ